MLDKNRAQRTARQLSRDGAIMPLFAFIFPMVLIMCAFAINLAYMQLINTELKIASDATSHAAGRALSEAQRTTPGTGRDRREAILLQVEAAIDMAAKENLVGGSPIVVPHNDQFIQYGTSLRAMKNGSRKGMYEFSQIEREDVLNNSDNRPSSVGVIGQIELPFVVGGMFNNPLNFTQNRRSIATQVDRDIALVLDKSGSMLSFKDEDAMGYVLDRLYVARWISYDDWTLAGANSNDFVNLYKRDFTADVRKDVGRYNRYDHPGADSRYAVDADLIADMKEYMDGIPRNHYYDSRGRFRSLNQTNRSRFSVHPAPHSLWSFLEDGVDAFLNVLEETEQEELVSLVTFNDDATLEYALSSDYRQIRDKLGEIRPLNGTGIGQGLEAGLPPVITGRGARPFAAKSIVILTDGVNTDGEEPETVVQRLVKSNQIIIDTVTFTPEADTDAMIAVANAGNGKHYHDDDGTALVQIFEEIANNLPTILTSDVTPGNKRGE